jgi:hypothetical protein
MIWHQAIRRANQLFADTGMKQNLTEITVKALVQPARFYGFNPHGPVNCGKTPIMRTHKSCEVMKVRVAHTAKLFHLPQKVSRVLTNAATTLLQGSSMMIPRSGAPPGKSAQ